MISQQGFKEQIWALGEILKDETNFRVKKPLVLRNVQSRIREYHGEEYIIIQQVLDNEITKAILVNLITISYHKSYQEPVIYFKCGEYSTKTMDQQLMGPEQANTNDDEYFAFGMIDPTEVKYEWDIDTIVRLNPFSMQPILPESSMFDNFFSNVSLDYHNVLTNEPWFFVHPCQTNVTLNSDNENDYLLNWISVYGKYLNISLNSRVIVCKNGDAKKA